ncbi:YceI family protein [Zavarzinia sp. CC-PAN008]|uniref:YceI family protein n=1 Tax=Zavarzinia sp. CC-PAN008 TaxID=3243332 RepID=UPI003F7486F2
MRRMHLLGLGLLAALALAQGAIAGAARADESPVIIGTLPAGDYTLDASHASLLFRVDHLGFSKYTARFKRFDAQLKLDPQAPDQAVLQASVEAASLETDYPTPETLDFNATLRGEQWLDAERHPQITFKSTRIELTGAATARIHGDFTLRGVTKPLVLEARFNGGYSGHPMDPNARIGFSAHATLNRSDFGMTYGIPAPGTRMGVGDAVEVILEVEFTGPPLAVLPTAE